MQINTILSLAGAVALGFGAGAASINQEEATTQEERGTQEAGVTADEIDPMQAWIEAGIPGEQHRALQPLVGTFDAVITHYMEGEENASEGSMTNAWIWDGRYLEQSYTGNWEGQEFMGKSLMGFSNNDQTYKGIWLDSMSTDISYSAGYAEEGNKVLHMMGAYTDPVSTQSVDFEDVITIISDDEHTFERYETRGGERAKSMNIAYTRSGN